MVAHRVGRQALHRVLAGTRSRRPDLVPIRRRVAADDLADRERRRVATRRHDQPGRADVVVHPLRPGAQLPRRGLDHRHRAHVPRRQRRQRRTDPAVLGRGSCRVDGRADRRPSRQPGHPVGQHGGGLGRRSDLVCRRRFGPGTQRRHDRHLESSRGSGRVCQGGARQRRDPARRQRPGQRMGRCSGGSRPRARAVRRDAPDRAHRLRVQRQRPVLVQQPRRAAARVVTGARQLRHTGHAAHAHERDPAHRRQRRCGPGRAVLTDRDARLVGRQPSAHRRVAAQRRGRSLPAPGRSGWGRRAGDLRGAGRLGPRA